MSAIKFGVNLNAPDPVAFARTAEAAGFDFVSVSDHPSGGTPSFEAWTLLSWIAASTSRIAVLPRVLSIPFRSPALVAKMAATLDRLSDSRLLLGLGGGATDGELHAFGLPVPSARDKVDGMVDAITVMRGLWTERAFTYAGRHHHTVEAEMEPKPARPIPIWLGTFGPRALAATGRLADGWIPSLGYLPDEKLPGMRAVVRDAAEAAGRDPDTVTCALNVTVSVGVPDTRPDAICGSAAEVTDRLAEFAKTGFTTFNLMLPNTGTTDQLAALATDVLPALRGRTKS